MFKPLGDSALLVQLGDKIDSAINQRVHALNELLQVHSIAGIIETVPAYCTLLIHYNPLILTFNQVTSWVRDNLTQVDDSLNRKPRQLEVPTRYGGASGPDLEAVAVSKGMSAADIVRIHSEREYTIYMMGFTPGFPYLGTLDERLIMPRMDAPRTLVRAGSVAIVGSQTGIYPLDSPGGWHLIGWSSLRLFDPASNSPFLFAPGDIIKFIPIGEDHA
jgi:KipI family sensor histidine kinase inhibitor